MWALVTTVTPDRRAFLAATQLTGVYSAMFKNFTNKEDTKRRRLRVMIHGSLQTKRQTYLNNTPNFTLDNLTLNNCFQILEPDNRLRRP